MAFTQKGRVLTDEHRRYQARLGAVVAENARVTAKMIDPSNIRGTIDAWMEEMLTIMAVAHHGGIINATDYVKAFRVAEWGQQGAGLPVVTPQFDVRQAASDLVWAPRLAQAGINKGLNPDRAWQIASTRLLGAVWRQGMQPGRDVVMKSAEKARSAWRRVCDGNPCAFCAMLVTRGPVYSADTVLTRYDGRKYHNCCGCTAEEYRGDPRNWEPTDREWDYIKLYNEAAGGSTDEVLREMRTNGQGIINDAHKPKTQTGAGSGGGKPPDRVRGMLGPDSPDEFPSFDGWTPPVRRSEIEVFDLLDAEILLLGDDSGHGFHSSEVADSYGKSGFPHGYTPQDVVDWVNAIIDNPKDGRRLNDEGEFVLFGWYGNVEGIVYVRRHGRWIIATGHPQSMEEWLRENSN